MKLIRIFGLILMAEAFTPPQPLQLRRHPNALALSAPSLSEEPGDALSQTSSSNKAEGSKFMATSFSVMKAMLGTGLLSLPSISNYPST